MPRNERIRRPLRPLRVYLGRSAASVLLVALSASGPVHRAEAEEPEKTPEVKPILEFRWRQEALDTLSDDDALDSGYGVGNLRLRFGLDLHRRRFSIHGLGQAAGAYSLPPNGSFGIGRVYFQASGGRDRSPGHLSLAELSIGFEPTDKVSLTGGRLALKDGLEILTRDPHFDWIKRTRLSERMIGTWDWVNVGRRFDGASIDIRTDRWSLTSYGARILQGGVDYENAFEHLDGVDVFGVFVTSKRGTWIPQSELRLFNLSYRDARPSTRGSLGDRLLVDALGASLVGVYPKGGGLLDLMLWWAYEFGGYGSEPQRALAFIGEGGYACPKTKWAPWVRAGLAYASGDGDPSDGDHRTFFNMAPTNHKFYGSQDLNAFQNLTNIYGQLQLRPHSRLVLVFDAHLFRLSEKDDAWYGGSGPANNRAFGYVARRPPGRGFSDADIGSELDLTARWRLRSQASFQFGLSHFQGGGVAGAVFGVKDSFTWFYVQALLGI